MADPETVIEQAAEAGAAAAAVVAENAVAEETAQEQREEIVEAAAAQVEQAQQTAREITAAAMNTELGREIGTLRSEVTECRTQITETKSLMQNLMDKFNSQIPAPAVAVVTNPPPAKQSSIPPQGSQTPQADQVNPDANPDLTGENQGDQEPQQRKPVRRRI
jgi:hypothetical protein